MDENVIFETQNITGFALNSTFGAFWKMVAPSPFELIEGQEYTVLWDNIEYTRTAFAFINPADGTSCIAVGNKMVSTGVNDGDLFAVVNDTTSNYTHFFSIENKTEHSVGIYQTAEDEPQEEVGIVIKNYSGIPIEYKGVEKVMFNTAYGGKRVYSKGDALEDVSIELDFSGGDQTVRAAEGTLVKSAVIKKPDTLVPENIAEGVDIAGIIGALAASSGGSAVITGGSFVAGGTTATVTHNLGVIPQIIMVYSTSTSIGKCFWYFLVDGDIASSHGIELPQVCLLRNSSGVQVRSGKTLNDTYKFLTSISTTSFTVGSGSAPLYDTKTYYWLAIGGLT